MSSRRLSILVLFLVAVLGLASCVSGSDEAVTAGADAGGDVSEQARADGESNSSPFGPLASAFYDLLPDLESSFDEMSPELTEEYLDVSVEMQALFHAVMRDVETSPAFSAQQRNWSRCVERRMGVWLDNEVEFQAYIQSHIEELGDSGSDTIVADVETFIAESDAAYQDCVHHQRGIFQRASADLERELRSNGLGDRILELEKRMSELSS